MTPQRRLLSKDEARAYLGDISDSTFYRWIEEGRIPPAIKGTQRWDRRAIDRALDRLSGIVPDSRDPEVAELDKALGLAR